MTPADVRANRRAVADVRRGRADEAELVEPARRAQLAMVMTWWTLAGELAVALAFLWPGSGRRLSLLRHGTLLVFTWTTYAFATVVGFGWLLMILGVSQCRPEEHRMRVVYVATYFLVFGHQVVPWITPTWRAGSRADAGAPKGSLPTTAALEEWCRHLHGQRP